MERNLKGEDDIMKNKVDVTICGADYKIAANESPEYIHRVAGIVDEKMTELLNASSKMSMTMVGVLTAVNICDEKLKADQTADNLRMQLKKYLDDADRAKQQADEYKRELQKTKSELAEVRERLDRSRGQTHLDLKK